MRSSGVVTLSSEHEVVQSPSLQIPPLADLRWRRKIGQAAKVGSTFLKDGLYDWETEAVLG
jgi:hypothetical protein